MLAVKLSKLTFQMDLSPQELQMGKCSSVKSSHLNAGLSKFCGNLYRCKHFKLETTHLKITVTAIAS